MSTPDDTETDDNNLNNTSYNTDSTDNVTEQDSDSDTITGAATDTEQSGEESLTDESDNTSPQPESGNDARNKTFENSTTHPKVKTLDKRRRRCTTAYFEILQTLKNKSSLKVDQKTRFLLKKNTLNLVNAMRRDLPITFKSWNIDIKGDSLCIYRKRTKLNITVPKFLASISLKQKLLFDFISNHETSTSSFSQNEKKAINVLCSFIKLNTNKIPFDKVREICS